MFPHLIGMKEVHRLSSEDMGAIIGKSRQTYEYKAQYGNFNIFESKALCRYFHKSFDYLFATMEEVNVIDEIAAERLGFVSSANDDAETNVACPDDDSVHNDTDQNDEDQANEKREAG